MTSTTSYSGNEVPLNTALETSRVNIDLTSLPNYTQLVAGYTYTIKTKAQASGYIDSDLSTGISYYVIPQLATPSNVVVSGTTATLDMVENATSYDIQIDGTSIGTYTPTTWEYPVLDNGNLTITQVYDATQQSGSNNITLE